MNPKDLNPYYVYLQAEIRKARQARDLALARYLADGVDRVARAAKMLVASIFRLKMRRDDAWVAALETRLRHHQPY